MAKHTTKVNMVNEVKLSSVPKATSILEMAAKALSVRGEQHGDMQESFTMIAQFWTTYVRHISAVYGEVKISASDVGQMMVLLKIARATYGEGNDHYVDEAGYSGIAGALSGEEHEDKERENV